MSIDIVKLERAAQFALGHFVRMDEANAAMHLAEVKYSPITFALAQALEDLAGSNEDIAKVLCHWGAYALDPGR